MRIHACVYQSKVNKEQFINFLIATALNATAMEAQRTQPISLFPIAHDAYTRLLHRLEPDSATLWQEVQAEVQQKSGVLILDDSVLDKPHAQKIELVHHMWSGKHRRVNPDRVQGRHDGSLVNQFWCSTTIFSLPSCEAIWR